MSRLLMAGDCTDGRGWPPVIAPGDRELHGEEKKDGHVAGALTALISSRNFATLVTN